MQSVDKNDVDVSKLFIWKKKFDILDTSKEIKTSVWIRVVGDADLNKARAYAIRESAKLRAEMKIVGSDARLTNLPDLADLTNEQLMELIKYASTNYITRLAIQQVETPYPVEPGSDADLEDMERFQTEVDGWADKRNSELQEYILDRFKELEERLSNESREELEKEYEKLLIEAVCESEMVSKFREMCTYLSCYKDEAVKERFFSSLEEFTNLPKFYKQQFIDLYQEIELGMDELKK